MSDSDLDISRESNPSVGWIIAAAAAATIVAAVGIGVYTASRIKRDISEGPPSDDLSDLPMEIGPNIFLLSKEGQFLDLMEAVSATGIEDMVMCIFKQDLQMFLSAVTKYAPSNEDVLFVVVDDNVVADNPSAGLTAVCGDDPSVAAAVHGSRGPQQVSVECFTQQPSESQLDAAIQQAIQAIGA